MRGLFTFACFLFILPTIIFWCLVANLAMNLAVVAKDLIGAIAGWVPDHLIQITTVVWLVLMGARILRRASMRRLWCFGASVRR